MLGVVALVVVDKTSVPPPLRFSVLFGIVELPIVSAAATRFSVPPLAKLIVPVLFAAATSVIGQDALTTALLLMPNVPAPVCPLPSLKSQLVVTFSVAG